MFTLSHWLYEKLATFERPRARIVTIALGCLLAAPCLFCGFALDDYVLLRELADVPGDGWAGRAPFDLFRWIDPAHTRILIDGGGLPWWTYGHSLVAFMRPLSSLSHTLDYALWPHSAFAMHVHSWLWFALFLSAVAYAYAQFIESRWVQCVATAMVALDSSHGSPVGWISNRNALISGTLCVLAIVSHHRARTRGGRVSTWTAWLCFAGSLLAGELGAAGAAYLLAYAVFIDRSSRASRLRSLLPYAAWMVGWMVARHVGEYGVYGGYAVYVDPLYEPLRFAEMTLTRMPVLLAGQISRFTADGYVLAPLAYRPFVVALASAACGVAAWFVWPSLRAHRSIRFFCAGALLGALPIVGASPSDRLLTLIGFGVMPALADAMHGAFVPTAAAWSSQSALRSLVASVMVLVHLVLDPLFVPVTAIMPAILTREVSATAASLPDVPGLETKTLIVADVPDPMLAYVPAMRAVQGNAVPAHLYWLLGTPAAARFERRGSHVLRVRCDSGFFDARWEERSRDLPMHPGDRIELSEMTVSVLEVTADGRPTLCDFVFKRPLESSRYIWMTWRDGRLVPFEPPHDGERRDVIAARST